MTKLLKELRKKERDMENVAVTKENKETSPNGFKHDENERGKGKE